MVDFFGELLSSELFHHELFSHTDCQLESLVPVFCVYVCVSLSCSAHHNYYLDVHQWWHTLSWKYNYNSVR